MAETRVQMYCRLLRECDERLGATVTELLNRVDPPSEQMITVVHLLSIEIESFHATMTRLSADPREVILPLQRGSSDVSNAD